MSSAGGARATLEAVRPTWQTGPAWSSTYGDLVGDLCRLAGFGPDPEQQLFLDALFAVDARGRVASFENAVIAPRQNLKTGVLKQAALGKLFVMKRRLIVWSAHEFSTAQEAFRDMDELCASHPSLSSRVKAVHRGNGDEAIELKGGQRLKFKARTKGGGRGLTGDDVFLDEAYALKAAHMGSLLPTLSARPDPQVVYASSAGQVDSSFLRSVRDRGRAGGERSLAFLEWGDDRAGEGCAADDCDHRIDTDGCALDDRSRWAAANPQMGRRISEDYIAGERRTLPPEEFARERLGWWDEPATAGVELTPAAWAGVVDSDVDVRRARAIVLAVDVAPGHTSSSITASGFDDSGRPVHELVERRPGSGWIVDRLPALAADYGARVALNSTGPVGTLLPDLRQRLDVVLRLDDELIDVRGADYLKACGRLVADVTARALRHHGEPELASAVLGAKARKSGDGFSFSRSDSSVDISPLVAVTVGHWALVSTDEDYDLGLSIF